MFSPLEDSSDIPMQKQLMCSPHRLISHLFLLFYYTCTTNTIRCLVYTDISLHIYFRYDIEHVETRLCLHTLCGRKYCVKVFTTKMYVTSEVAGVKANMCKW